MTRRASFVGVAVAVLGLASACGASAPAEAPARRAEPAASWADVFEGTPDLYAVVRPAAIKRDGVYGAFWSSLIRAAEARGLGRGSTMIEAADGAESIVLGLSHASGAGVDDAELVLTGVPANLDPLKMSDGHGRPLFRLVSDRARVAEYELMEGGAGSAGSLFVLPDRTWVGALGEARSRARQAFATPLGRPPPKADPQALATVRVAGPLAHALDKHPRFGSLGRRLATATFSLMPGKRGAVVLLAYEDADAAAWGEQRARQLAAELSATGTGEPALAWLKSAKIRYEVNTVRIEVDIPPRLLEELPKATGADLGP